MTSMLAVPFAVIPAEPVEPLWPGWAARKHVTLVVAPGGSSKGLWAIDIAARVTTGRAWPGEPESAVRKPEAVILIAPEDDANESVAWRLKAAGADPALVFNLTTFADGSPFIVPDSLPELRAAITEVAAAAGVPVGLVIIDPLLATVEHSITSNIAARRVVDPLKKLARERGVAFIVTHHTTKAGTAAGSKGLTDSVRHVLRIDRPKGAPKGTLERVLSVEKSNMGSDGAQLQYTVIEDGNDTRIEYPAEAEAGTAAGAGRGYTILGEVPDAADVPDVPHILVHAEQGKTPVQLGGGPFLSAEKARLAARADAGGQVLTWYPGAGGGQRAGVLKGGPGGTIGSYTVFPVKDGT